MAIATGQFTIVDFNDINISTTSPASPVIDNLWLDTSFTPHRLKRWDGTLWVGTTALTLLELDAAQNTKVNSTYAAMTDMADDNKLTALEKQDVKKEWDSIVSEKPLNDSNATTFGVTTEKTTYETAYTALRDYLTVTIHLGNTEALLSSLTTTSVIEGTTFRSTFKSYYDARTALVNAIFIKAKAIADGAVTPAQLTTKLGEDYVITGKVSADLIDTGILNGVTINAKNVLNVASNVWDSANGTYGLNFGAVITGYVGPAQIQYLQGLTGDGTTRLQVTVPSVAGISFAGAYAHFDCGLSSLNFESQNTGKIGGIGLGNTNEIWADASPSLYLSYRGSDAGTTNFVNTLICNGKGTAMATFDGANANMDVDCAIKMRLGGSDGFGVRNLNLSGRAPAISYATVYCTNGATVYYDHPDVAGAYQAVATGRDTATAVKATAGATTTATYFAGTTSGYINIALLAYV